MKKAVALTLLAVAVVVFLSLPQTHNDVVLTVTPADSSFTPIDHRSYTPPLLPALSKRSAVPPVTKLPRGVRERDVRRVVQLEWKGVPAPTNIIELKNGEVFVEKDSPLERVTVVDYNPPVLALGLFPGIGVSLGLEKGNVGEPWRNRAKLSPVLKASFVEVCGTVKLPMIAADLDGAGIGAEWTIYHDIAIGAALFGEYSNLNQRSFKVTLQFNF